MKRPRQALLPRAARVGLVATLFSLPCVANAGSQGAPEDFDPLEVEFGDAQERPPEGERAPEEASELGRSLRRILILENGQVLRGVARLADGAWEIKHDGGTASIEPRRVKSHELEKEVLNEVRRRERGLGKKSTSAERVEHARWLADVGLHAEALEELDRVLSSDPHDRGARALLVERGFVRVPSLNVPEEARADALAELITFGAKAPRAVRELAIEELRSLALSEDAAQAALVRDALLEEFRDFSLRRRSFAAHAFGRLYPGEEPRKLILHAVLDASAEVRREASFAIGASEEPGLIVPMVKALNSANPRVRTQAAEALGNVGFGAAVEPLVSRLTFASAQGSGGNRVPHGSIFIGRQKAYIQDFDVEVAQFQAVADPQVNVLIEGSVLNAGVSGVTSYGFAYETKVIRGALGQLTGEEPGYSSRAWLRWWEENQERWSSARLSAPDGAPVLATEAGG